MKNGTRQLKKEKWLAVLAHFIHTGHYGNARTHIYSLFIFLGYEPEELEEVPFTLNEQEWESYYIYLKRKLEDL